MANSIIENVVRKLPSAPGVYQFFNQAGEIIYVGKAKDLRKRVNSYFTTEAKSYKHNALVSKITDIKYILVENESDALLLENNLIKEYQPRYNILLKDDKTFPWICIKKERFPRVFSTRNYIADGSEYFGPYTSGLMVKTLLQLIRHIFKLRTCNLVLCAENILKRKYKRCLEYHLGNCKAPCENLQNVDEYNQAIDDIREILKGNIQIVIKHLNTLMRNYANNLQFEEAETIRSKILVLENFRSKSTIVNTNINDIDVFSIIDEEGKAYINFLKVAHGAIVQAHNVEVIKKIDEEPSDMLLSVIINLRNRFQSNSPEIIVPFDLSMHLNNISFIVPKRGDKLKLLALSQRNAESYRRDLLLKIENERNLSHHENLLILVQKDLRLKMMPLHIECFDNSNIQGAHPVASCVVFVNGKPDKSKYRHFNIKTVTGPNDFASMKEIVFRRYKRILEEGGLIPQLIIVDGGKGQLSAAVESLKQLEIYDKVSIIGIAKRLEEIYIPEDPIPLYINKNSESLRLIQRIRDEAHRFGITFHQSKRSKSQLNSFFSTIPGIGEKTKDKILRIESDIEKIRNLSKAEMEEKFGKRAGNLLFNYFNQKIIK